LADSKPKTAAKKPAAKKPAATPKPAAAPKPAELTDADLVTALAKVQKRGLATPDFVAVTNVIKLLSE